MRVRALAVGIALVVVGILVGQAASVAEVPPAGDPCAAPWEVKALASRPASGNAPQEGGAVVLKYNRCTGAAFVLSFDGPMLEQDDKNAGTVWRLYPTEGAKQ